MIQIAVCDDDIKELERTHALITDYHRRHPQLDILCRKFQSSYDLLDCIQARPGFDVYLLDIMMPGTDGIETGSIIREKDEDASIVFLSSSSEFGVKSYQVRAFDYLIKPIDAQRLSDSLDRLVDKITQQRASVFPVKVRSGVAVIRSNQLIYVEYQNHKCFYHLSDGSTIETITLRESFDEAIAPLLSDRHFAKTAAAYLVNMTFVQSVIGKDLLLTDGNRLPVSRILINDLRKSFMTYLLERGRGK